MSVQRRERRKFERQQKKLIQKFHLMNIQKFKGMTDQEIKAEITKYNIPPVHPGVQVTEEMIEEFKKSKEEN